MKKILLLCITCLLFSMTALAAEGEKEVVRALFSTGIEQKEPVESITEYYPVDEGVLYFFTELKNMEDTEVLHVWHKNGEEIYKFTNNISAPRWRTYSSMKAMHFKSGDEITVNVVGADGEIYDSATLSIR